MQGAPPHNRCGPGLSLSDHGCKQPPPHPQPRLGLICIPSSKGIRQTWEEPCLAWVWRADSGRLHHGLDPLLLGLLAHCTGESQGPPTPAQNSGTGLALTLSSVGSAHGGRGLLELLQGGLKSPLCAHCWVSPEGCACQGKGGSPLLRDSIHQAHEPGVLRLRGGCPWGPENLWHLICIRQGASVPRFSMSSRLSFPLLQALCPPTS